MALFKSLKKPPLSQEVQRQLLESITSGVFAPGDKLPSERELMEQFEVSRVTIRDALRIIQSLGLVTIKRGVNAGTYVCEPTGEPITKSFENLIAFGKVNFSHLIQARLIIEPEAARIAATCATDKDIANLQTWLEKAAGSVHKSLKEARLANERFHHEIACISKNPIIIYITESITQVYLEMLIEMTGAKLGKNDILRLVDQHRGILKPIMERNGDEAARRVTEHLLTAYSVYSRIIPGGFDKEINRHIELLKKS